MKQIEATEATPFYSVCYQYDRNPWTLFSCNRFGTGKFGAGNTMSGTNDFELAKCTARRLVTEAGIVLAVVHKSTDCYNHKTVFEVKA